jgi:aminopeptidase N
MNLYWFFNQWVYKAGYPELKVTEEWNEARKELKLTVDQIQKRDSLCGYFRLPVDIRFVTHSTKRLERVMVDSARSVFTFTLPEKPLLVSFDHGTNLCAKILYQKSTQDIVYQLLNDEDHAQRIVAGRSLIERATEPNALDAVKRSIQNDSYFGVRQQLVERLASVNADTIAYRSVLKDILLLALRDVRSSIRSTALGGLRKMKDVSLRTTFEKMLRDSSYYVIAASLQCLTDIDSIPAAPMLRKYLSYPSYRDAVVTTAMELLVRLKDQAAIPELRAKALPGGSITLRTSAIAALAKFMNVDSEIWNFLRDRLNEPSSIIQESALNAIAQNSDARTAPLLDEIIKTSSDERVKSAAKKLRTKL